MVLSKSEESRVKLRQEQINLSSMTHLVGNFTNSGEFFVDCFWETYAVSKADLLILKHCFFDFCDMDEAFIYSEESLF